MLPCFTYSDQTGKSLGSSGQRVYGVPCIDVPVGKGGSHFAWFLERQSIYICIHFQILFHNRLLQDTE